MKGKAEFLNPIQKMGVVGAKRAGLAAPNVYFFEKSQIM